MNKVKKIWMIIITLSIFLIILIVTISLLNKPPKLLQPSISPTPTFIPSFNPVNHKGSQTIKIVPTFTGVNEEIPQEILNYAQQKQKLKKMLPLSLKEGIITYDYGNDQFIVTLQQPESINKALFQSWITKNYTQIPINKFLFK